MTREPERKSGWYALPAVLLVAFVLAYVFTPLPEMLGLPRLKIAYAPLRLVGIRAPPLGPGDNVSITHNGTALTITGTKVTRNYSIVLSDGRVLGPRGIRELTLKEPPPITERVRATINFATRNATWIISYSIGKLAELLRRAHVEAPAKLVVKGSKHIPGLKLETIGLFTLSGGDNGAGMLNIYAVRPNATVYYVAMQGEVEGRKLVFTPLPPTSREADLVRTSLLAWRAALSLYNVTFRMEYAPNWREWSATVHMSYPMAVDPDRDAPAVRAPAGWKGVVLKALFFPPGVRIEGAGGLAWPGYTIYIADDCLAITMHETGHEFGAPHPCPTQEARDKAGFLCAGSVMLPRSSDTVITLADLLNIRVPSPSFARNCLVKGDLVVIPVQETYAGRSVPDVPGVNLSALLTDVVIVKYGAEAGYGRNCSYLVGPDGTITEVCKPLQKPQPKNATIIVNTAPLKILAALKQIYEHLNPPPPWAQEQGEEMPEQPPPPPPTEPTRIHGKIHGEETGWRP